MAMIRQLGCPTFFLTLSSSENRWPELLKILAKVLDQRELTDEEIAAMTIEEKNSLIRRDPITCSRYFYERMKTVWSLLKSRESPFYPYSMVDWMRRDEFQQRGSAHIHSLLYMKNKQAEEGDDPSPPHYEPGNEESERACVAFIDTYITCSRTAVDANLLTLQTHKHTFCCKRVIGEKRDCRFGFPLFPMRQTRILDPLPAEERTNQLKTTRHEIMNFLEAVWKTHRETPASFDDFLRQLNLNEATYVRALRVGLKTSKVFLRRNPDEIKINAYNADLLEMHRSNMDLQFIVDPYSCVQYILGYINKSKRGMSKILREVTRQTNAGNQTHRERLRVIGSMFLNATEISAQEAAYYLLQLKVCQFSTVVVYINTAPPDRRVRVVRSEAELQRIVRENPGSTDIFKLNILDYYVNRSERLENLCLAVIVADFDYVLRRNNRPAAAQPEDFDDDGDDEDDDQLEEQGGPRPANEVVDVEMEEPQPQELPNPEPQPQELPDPEPHQEPQPGEYFPVANHGGFLKKRTKRKIIRYRRYNEHQDPLNYYAEQLMLFWPYRNEAEMRENAEQLYHANLETIRQNRAAFAPADNEQMLEAALEEAQRLQEEEEEAENAEAADPPLDNEFDVFNPRPSQEQPEFFEQIGIPENEQQPRLRNNGAIELYRMPRLVPADELLENLTRLNRCQRRIFMEILSLIKSGQRFYIYISGSAGVGKSFLINIIYQAVTRYLNRQAGTDLSTDKVLLCAFTRKAAFNIRGMTIHSAFSLPVSQFGGAMAELSNDVANTLRANLFNVGLFIYDEVSMIGRKIFSKVDTRKKQIYGNNLPFGGKSVIVVGDLNQLCPVGDT